MITNFNEKLFIDTKDANVAIFIENLAAWIRFNASKDNPEDRNFHEGRYWSYNSYPAFAKLFQGWSAKVIRNIVDKCEQLGLIIIGNFNKKCYDNTNWYTLTDKALEYYPVVHGLFLNTPAQTGSTPAQMGRPIPEHLTSSSNINITNSEFDNSPVAVKGSKNKNSLDLMQLINVYRELFPNNPQPHKRVISTSLKKTLLTLIKRWPELDPNGNPLSYEAFRRYLTALKEKAPQFALGEYVTQEGNRKKNTLETFARWNTVVKFLENSYS